MEPWDGPASIPFTDGKYIGALLDRNGLRPARYFVMDDDTVVLASEAGTLPVDESKVISKWRLQPGKMLLIDLIDGKIISDKEIDDELSQESVIYRPESLVIGIGLHWDTTKDTIKEGIDYCLDKFNLSSKSIAKLVSIKKPEDVQGLIDLGKEMQIPVEYVDREELAEIITPNPSTTVKAFEGTASVSEAAAIKVSKGELIVEKQKFPPNLTVAIARKID